MTPAIVVEALAEHVRRKAGPALVAVHEVAAVDHRTADDRRRERVLPGGRLERCPCSRCRRRARR